MPCNRLRVQWFLQSDDLFARAPRRAASRLGFNARATAASSYSFKLNTVPRDRTGPPTAAKREAPARCSARTPESERMGAPAHSASNEVVWPF